LTMRMTNIHEPGEICIDVNPVVPPQIRE
jgi:hypothetical protein